MKFLCCGQSRAFCTCVPIAAGALLFSIVSIANGALLIIDGGFFRELNGEKNPEYWTIGYGTAVLIVGIAGVAVCLACCGALALFWCNVVLFFLTVIYFVLQWIYWGVHMNATPQRIVFGGKMVLWTLFYLAFLVAIWVICDLFLCMDELLRLGYDPWMPGGGRSKYQPRPRRGQEGEMMFEDDARVAEEIRNDSEMSYDMENGDKYYGKEDQNSQDDDDKYYMNESEDDNNVYARNRD